MSKEPNIHDLIARNRFAEMVRWMTEKLDIKAPMGGQYFTDIFVLILSDARTMLGDSAYYKAIKDATPEIGEMARRLMLPENMTLLGIPVFIMPAKDLIKSINEVGECYAHVVMDQSTKLYTAQAWVPAGLQGVAPPTIEIGGCSTELEAAKALALAVFSRKVNTKG